MEQESTIKQNNDSVPRKELNVTCLLLLGIRSTIILNLWRLCGADEVYEHQKLMC